ALRGEWDLYNRPELEAALLEAEAADESLVVLDLSRATFIDSSVLGALVDARKRLQERVRIAVVAEDRQLRKVFEITGTDAVITPVWAPSGIALVALLRLGGRFWPAVAVGAFSANVASGAGASVAAAIAVGNTLEAVAGAGLLRRFGISPRLARVRDVLAFVLLAAGASTAI